MRFQKLPIKPWVTRANRRVEGVVNRVVRGRDQALGALRLGGRAADYDDERYEFVGGPADNLRKQHYDKSLRLLWKAEEHAPWSTFRDCTQTERQLLEMAEQAMSAEERQHRKRIRSDGYRDMLKQEYSLEERQALAAILSAIGHGEAYAWLVAAQNLQDVKGTGSKAAVSMQVLEEAKHFLVLRELIQALDVEVPRLNAYEYLLLEGCLKAEGLEKFFAMNVVVEGIAIAIFGMLADLPGMEILELFHRDESRHTGLPNNYLKEYPLTWWQKHSPRARLRRLQLVLPTLGMILAMEQDAAELGIDIFAFGGSVVRKLSVLADRNGYLLPMSFPALHHGLNQLFNAYCSATRDGHTWQDFLSMETTTAPQPLEVEREVFYAMPNPA